MLAVLSSSQKILRAFVMAATSLTFATAASSDVSWDIRRDHATSETLVVVIHDQIRSSDRDELERATLAGMEVADKRVVLTSDGGDLDAAIQMGMVLRDHKYDAIVPPGYRCLSACVYLLAASIDKMVFGDVGIHRPYFAAGNSADVASEIKAVRDSSAAYFNLMNIPEKLAEDMFGIDPGKMRILTIRELEDYRLNSMDYAAQEEVALEAMSSLGMSRIEYEAFRKDLDYSCRIYIGRPDEMEACVAGVISSHGASILE